MYVLYGNNDLPKQALSMQLPAYFVGETSEMVLNIINHISRFQLISAIYTSVYDTAYI